MPETHPTPETALRPAADWQRLQRVALLGTRQSPDELPAVPGFTLPEDAPDHREKQALLSAGVLSTIRKAGYQPAAATAATIPPAAPETQAALGVSGAQLLQQLLEGQYPELLPEFLVALAENQRRVPHQLLVTLLEYARTRSALHRPAAAVLGQRGAWLAVQNPAWQIFLAASEQATEETAWETGTIAQRTIYLETLRRRAPTQARELLAAVLPQEPARHQAQLLETLQEQLSTDDAALLTQYLAAKSKEVRQTVLPLLVRLPDSAVLERLWQRAELLVRLKSNLLSKKLLVELPASDWDKTWLLDGIEQKDSRFPGEKAALLGQLLALIPPQRWAEHWSLTPAKIIDLAADTEWAELLLTAWSEAAVLHQDAGWARALLEWLHAQPRKKAPGLPVARLAAVLPPAQLTELVLPLLNATPHFSTDAPWQHLLQLVPAPWPETLTRRVVELLRRALRQPTELYRIQYAASQLLEHMARVVPAAQYGLCAEALQPLLQDVPYLHNSLARLLNTLHFRQQLAEALHEPPAPG
ncbi:DUF5691 domain-containing protein [Hymenobacter psychrotolerans]|uniref:Uncharacterized protein n=1 Tax=Hymenobacter psychrotolerans DSM 18569 TaxID=1121959 RepID=A0A1M7F9C5_9BACT|nr:DUF5691 domain-containing protein [Hymenobacter psychrotolerans]SHM00682.1 hypothetical protein SAMN02746009_03790 [Hymenobacter psychrotolerans DSM 18569]